MPHQILIAEDNEEISQLLLEGLGKHGYACTCAYSGTEALLHLKQAAFDLILLDLMLPGKDGEHLLQEIKPRNPTPVIVLTAKDALDTKVDVLRLGADDYMTKPFAMKELLARMEVQLRRAAPAGGGQVLRHKDMVLDKSARQVQVNGQPLSLTRQEFQILELLLTYPKRVFSKQDIYEYAWQDYYIGEDKTINVHISNIRQKIKQITAEPYIETVWGIGFKFAV